MNQAPDFYNDGLKSSLGPVMPWVPPHTLLDFFFQRKKWQWYFDEIVQTKLANGPVL